MHAAQPRLAGLRIVSPHVLNAPFQRARHCVDQLVYRGASVFGGGSNLKTAVKNIFDIYNPDIIAVHTTCLTETIGDDLTSYIQDLDIPDGRLVIHTNTPSYVGSHITGFSNMMSGFIKYLSESTGAKNGKAAIFPGFVNPGDIREIKRIAELMA